MKTIQQQILDNLIFLVPFTLTLFAVMKVALAYVKENSVGKTAIDRMEKSQELMEKKYTETINRIEDDYKYLIKVIISHDKIKL